MLGPTLPARKVLRSRPLLCGAATSTANALLPLVPGSPGQQPGPRCCSAWGVALATRQPLEATGNVSKVLGKCQRLLHLLPGRSFPLETGSGGVVGEATAQQASTGRRLAPFPASCGQGTHPAPQCGPANPLFRGLCRHNSFTIRTGTRQDFLLFMQKHIAKARRPLNIPSKTTRPAPRGAAQQRNCKAGIVHTGRWGRPPGHHPAADL